MVTLLQQKSQEIAIKLSLILNRSIYLDESMVAEARGLLNKFHVNATHKKNYPLYIHSPGQLEKLKLLTRELKNKGIKMVLVVPLRSKWSAQFIDELSAQALARSYQDLADRLGVLLFQPGTYYWENENFVDSGHLNHIGRERFLKGLKTWWNANQ